MLAQEGCHVAVLEQYTLFDLQFNPWSRRGRKTAGSQRITKGRAEICDRRLDYYPIHHTLKHPKPPTHPNAELSEAFFQSLFPSEQHHTHADTAAHHIACDPPTPSFVNPQGRDQPPPPRLLPCAQPVQ
jgi:hypothetical protein